MEKKTWIRPVTVVEQFAANEYIAACGDENKVYKFKCNAPGGVLYYYPNSDGYIDGSYNGSGSANRLGGYYPCRDQHMANATDVFFDGFVDYNYNGRHDNGEGVIVWVEFGRHGTIRDYHATKELDMKSWETAKS